MVIDWLLDTPVGSLALGWGWLPVSACTLVMSVWGLRGHSVFTRVFASLLFAASVFLLCAFMPIAWFFRDGLGPEAIPSYGWEAVLRFWGLLAPLLFVSGLLVGFGLLLCYGPWGVRSR